MRLIRVTSHIDEENEIQSVTVEHDGSGEASGRVVEVELGRAYTVQPPNPQKLKHRDRRCTVLDWVVDDLGNVEAVKVRFDDNNRQGKVELGDLAEIPSEPSSPLMPQPR